MDRKDDILRANGKDRQEYHYLSKPKTERGCISLKGGVKKSGTFGWWGDVRQLLAKKVPLFIFLPFDTEAFKTCKNTIQLRIYVCVKFLNYYFSIGDSKQKIFPTKSCS